MPLYSACETTSRLRHLSKQPLLQKGHITYRKNATDSNEVGQRSSRFYLCRVTQNTKITGPRKRGDKKQFGPDSQDHIQPN